ncbi:MAG: 2,3-bisphosphoglycerate-independent phosphoglycerate mutase [Rickettsiales bacterium]
MSARRPIILCILDGWGIGSKGPHNAITNANPNFYNYLIEKYPSTKLQTSGKHVGLPNGQMGNSEVGHMTIGSGRIIQQDLVKISEFFKNGDIEHSISFNQLSQSNKPFHVIGLLSDGGIHSHIDHALNVCDFLLKNDKKVYLHIITDGRDTSPKSCAKYIKKLSKYLKDKNFLIATVSGRYYSMDRDNRADRTQFAANAITKCHGEKYDDLYQTIDKSYKHKIYDEFFKPAVSSKYQGLNAYDNIIFYNFRPDRMRQLVEELHKQSSESNIYTMTHYSDTISTFAKVLFPKSTIENTLGELLSKKGLRQLRVSETEKYPHVTYFFNGGNEEEYPGEDRILTNSPKVATYDLCPEMSAYKVTDFIKNKASSYDFVLVNYPNADMVGHTGNYEATKKAVSCIDKCLEVLYKQIVKNLGGILIITADHGNAELMFDKKTQQRVTSHTTNPVPFIVIADNLEISLEGGGLDDIAPTILGLFNIEQPISMTGKNLIKKKK